MSITDLKTVFPSNSKIDINPGDNLQILKINIIGGFRLYMIDNIDKTVYDTVQQGLDEINSEIDKNNSIEEQAEIIAKDMMLHNFNSKVDVEGTLYIFSLSTGKKNVMVAKNKYQTIPTYVLTVTDVNKAFGVQQENLTLLDAMNKMQGIEAGSPVNLSPKVYKPMVLELEIDDSLEDEQMINLLCKTAIAKLLGEFIIEELPEEGE